MKSPVLRGTGLVHQNDKKAPGYFAASSVFIISLIFASVMVILWAIFACVLTIEMISFSLWLRTMKPQVASHETDFNGPAMLSSFFISIFLSSFFASCLAASCAKVASEKERASTTKNKAKQIRLCI